MSEKSSLTSFSLYIRKSDRPNGPVDKAPICQGLAEKITKKTHKRRNIDAFLISSPIGRRIKEAIQACKKFRAIVVLLNPSLIY